MRRGLGLLVVATVLGLCAGAVAQDATLSADANAKFLEHNAKQPGVVTRPSGLQYNIIRNGSGKSPAPDDSVEVYYTGTLINGAIFDGTEDGFPRVVHPKDVIGGWKEAFSIMHEGDHWRLVVPAALGYGSKGSADSLVPPDQTLVFDLDILRVSAKSDMTVR